MPRVASAISVADEVWVAAALLHREQPKREDFTIAEIVARAQQEHLSPTSRPGVRVYATAHAVANRPPNPGRYRMLFATGRHTRRLYRPGDPCHLDREGAKSVPEPEELPSEYRYLLEWYWTQYARKAANPKNDPLLQLRGSGKKLWADEHADDYVRRLRAGWE